MEDVCPNEGENSAWLSAGSEGRKEEVRTGEEGALSKQRAEAGVVWP